MKVSINSKNEKVCSFSLDFNILNNFYRGSICDGTNIFQTVGLAMNLPKKRLKIIKSTDPFTSYARDKI